MVRALAFHQCGPGSISAPGVICGLSYYFGQIPFEGKFSSFPLILIDNPVAVLKQGTDSVWLYQKLKIPWEKLIADHKSTFCKL